MYIFDVNWTATTAGPSPFNNERTELFLLGCEKARQGNPCKGCFNQKTWCLPENATYHDPVESAHHLIKYAPTSYLTIGGGEPTDIIKELVVMCRILKQYGFHILCYTWRDTQKALSGAYGKVFQQDFKDLLMTIDGLIDGEFILEQRCYDNTQNDGLFNAIGSLNQHLVVKNTHNEVIAYPIGGIKKITFKDKGMCIDGEGINYGIL